MGAPDYYAGIVGVQQCMKHRDSCDLSAGIITGPHTVTFHLSKPDPEFLAKLALAWASPAPPESPAGMAPVDHPIPGTGPYRITEVHELHSVLVTRNPYFRTWSVAARPPGYPDRILFFETKDGSRATQEVLTGQVDPVDRDQVPATLRHRILVEHPELLHRSSDVWTNYLVLNTLAPPFDHMLARRAVAAAIDRKRFTPGSGAWAGAEPACQMLPAGYPGFDPYCPFPSGRDLALGRRLVRQSGTQGARVVVFWPAKEPEEVAAGRYLVRLLHDLGYRSRIHLVHGGLAYYGQPAARKDIAIGGRYADFPTASQFFGPASCKVGRNGPDVVGRYCNPGVDRLARAATAAQDQDPGRADRLWRAVYRRILRDVAVIPVNHQSQGLMVSPRVGNYHANPLLGPLYDQLWVR